MKKNIRIILPIVIIVGLLFGAAGSIRVDAKGDRPSDMVVALKSDMRILGGNRTIRSGEIVDRNVIVMGGDLEIEEDATVRGDLTLYGGDIDIRRDATIEGTIRVYGGSISIDGNVLGDLYIVGGEADLLDHAVINGEIKSVGGEIDRSSGSRVYGGVQRNYVVDETDNSFFGIRTLRGLPFIGGLFRFGRVSSFFWQVIVLGFVAFLLMTFVPKRVEEAESYLVKDKLVLTAIIGLAGLIVLPIGMALTAITLILIPLTILLVLVYIAAILMGFVILGSILGRDLGRRMQLKWEPIWLTVFGTAVVALAWWVFEMLPDVLEWLPQLAMLSIGFGAATQYIYEKTLGRRKSVSFTANVNYDGKTPVEVKIRQSSKETTVNVTPVQVVEPAAAAEPGEPVETFQSADAAGAVEPTEPVNPIELKDNRSVLK